MTLRGEQPPSTRYPVLITWMEQATVLTTAVFEAAARDGLGEKERRQLILKVDGRPISMQTILDGVQYHMSNEYQYLLKNETSDSLTAIYSSNLNDQYRVQRLGENLEKIDVKAAVEALAEHLNRLPVTDSKPATQQL